MKWLITFVVALLAASCSTKSDQGQAGDVAKSYSVEAPDSGASARSMLQAAIDECSVAGGGRVVVSPGNYFINGNIVLKSGVDLHLEEGATLTFSGEPDDFLPVVYTRWEGTELYGRSPMVYALHATDIAITGSGTIDAQGGKTFASWAAIESEDVNRLRAMGGETIDDGRYAAPAVPVHERIFGEGAVLRPSCIQFIGCTRVLIEGVTIKHSPFWTIHPVYCDSVTVRGVTIDSHYPNNDGCDPESTSNVLIEDCTFRTGDDAIAIKAGRDADGRAIGRPSKNITIRNCRFFSECNGLCIGSEMSGGVEGVYMENIEIGTVKNAIYFKSNRDRGGYIRDVQVRNVTVERAKGAILRFETNYFGFRGGNYPAQYEHFNISNIKAVAADNYALFFDGYETAPVRDITVENMIVENAPHPYYMRCTEDITLKDVVVNGEAVPHDYTESEERVTLDVY